LDRSGRRELAAKRLLKVVERHGAAIPRTLEQKISDAGPLNQRIDPHILIPVRNELVKEGRLQLIREYGRNWYALPDASPDWIAERMASQFEVLRHTLDNAFMRRMGDALEIAVFRALKTSNLHSLGGFRGLTAEPTTKSPRKEEPPSIFGGRELQGNKRFDFLVGQQTWAAIECKNIREWLYPDREEIRHMLRKSVELNIPAILIGRRIPFVTRRLLQPTGVLLWETRHQFYPPEHDNLAAQMREKTSLGFFDIRVSDYPTPQLEDFISRIIPEELAGANERFAVYRDLIAAYAFEDMHYTEFAARVRRRQNGQNEDRDDDPSEERDQDEDDNYDDQ
jgi:hypothetical protein